MYEAGEELQLRRVTDLVEKQSMIDDLWADFCHFVAVWNKQQLQDPKHWIFDQNSNANER